MICTKCGEDKDQSAFYFHSDGRPRCQCKLCRNHSNTLWKSKNKDKVKSYTTEEQYQRNLEASKQWRKNNLAYDAFRAKTYRSRKTNQVPHWANLDKIKEIYLSCPKGYHVDHIIPLKGQHVSGLHVETNLQHLPASDNIRKKNHYDDEFFNSW